VLGSLLTKPKCKSTDSREQWNMEGPTLYSTVAKIKEISMHYNQAVLLVFLLHAWVFFPEWLAISKTGKDKRCFSL
jgi:hypothetical protein